MHNQSRLWASRPVVAMALVASFSIAALPSASAEPEKPTSTRVVHRIGIAPGQAWMGWRNASSPAPGVAPLVSKAARSGVQGMDVSGWQKTVNWAYWKAHGKTFAYVKATEGTKFRNPYFGAQYTGAGRVGMFRGAYHFAAPSSSSGYAQANYFVAHGGAWKRDGRTLPGVLDIEYNPYGRTCYGVSKTRMVGWIKSFTARYKALTSRDAVIYTTRDWWARCTGNSTAFSTTNPLWVARYASAVGALPGGWPFYTFWQHTPSPLDQNRFSAKRNRLVALAHG